MSKTIGQLNDAGSLAGTEQVELYKLSTSVTITASTISAQASDNSFNDSGSGFVTAGFLVGDHINVLGFTGNTANNIYDAVVTAVTAAKLTIGGPDGDVIVDDAAGESVSISKWESKRSTYAGSSSGGGVLQTVHSQSAAVATGTTVIPVDDTIPQNTEGTEFLTATITPTSATNKLLIEVLLSAGCATASRAISVALFQDSAADALAASQSFQATANGNQLVSLRYLMTAGTTSATTFKVRAGPNAAGTITVNGVTGGRLFGGVGYSAMTITEVVP